MSVLFYRRPDYMNKPNGRINATECARYVERAKKSESAIPGGLSFEDVMNNKSLPPCSLNDFMDYLVYVEFNAENLQFYLWYKDYASRFEGLPDAEKALSPAWNPVPQDIPNLVKDPENEQHKARRQSQASSIAGLSFDGKKVVTFSDDGSNKESVHLSTVKENGNFSAPSLSDASTVPTTAEVTAQAGLKWQPFAVQPGRDEVNRVMRHYLAFTAPRELNLSHKDRAACLHALQHTTHPSAFAPAVKIAETALRGQSHPNFIRWSICNGNKPRVVFVRTMGVSNISLGFLVAILLTLSRASRWYRILAALLWLIGISTMVAAYKGLCVIMHRTHARNLRPWEQDLDTEMGEFRRGSMTSIADGSIKMAPSSSQGSKYEDTDRESDSNYYRPASMKTFGPKNSFDDASWREKYEKKPLLKKVFDNTTWTQDETLRVLQDRIVLGANLWALILTIPVTVAIVALPKGNFY